MENAKGSKTGLLIIVIAVIIIAAVLLYAFLFRGGEKGSHGSASHAPTASVSYAPAGELTPGFPSALVIDAASSSAPETSYSIAYDASTTQSTAIFDSPRPMLYVSIAYLNWFNSDGWKVTSRSPLGASSSMEGITATKSGATASVTVSQASATSSRVTVSYVTQ